MLDLVNNVDVIDLKTSNEIIKCIKDVTNITDEEKKNIITILDTKSCNYDALENLRKYIKTSYYKQIDNVKYDRSLLLLADNLVKGRGDGRISDDDMKQLIKSAEDNNVITVCEKNTLYYILKNYNTTDKAKTQLETYFNN
jgi:hypothetical protein